MKKIKSFLLLGILLVSVNHTGTAKTLNPGVEEDIEIVQREVVNFLRSKALDIQEEHVVTLLLSVNHRNEIIVLDTGSDNKKINDFVRRYLNYQLLPGVLKRGGGTFICPVKLTPQV